MIRNKLVAFLAQEVAALSNITIREAKEGFLSLSKEDVVALLSALNKGDEMMIGQLLYSAVRAAHIKKAQDKVLNALADDSLSFADILKRLRAISS